MALAACPASVFACCGGPRTPPIFRWGTFDFAATWRNCSESRTDPILAAESDFVSKTIPGHFASQTPEIADESPDRETGFRTACRFDGVMIVFPISLDGALVDVTGASCRLFSDCPSQPETAISPVRLASRADDELWIFWTGVVPDEAAPDKYAPTPSAGSTNCSELTFSEGAWPAPPSIEEVPWFRALLPSIERSQGPLVFDRPGIGADPLAESVFDRYERRDPIDLIEPLDPTLPAVATLVVEYRPRGRCGAVDSENATVYRVAIAMLASDP